MTRVGSKRHSKKEKNIYMTSTAGDSYHQ